MIIVQLLYTLNKARKVRTHSWFRCIITIFYVAHDTWKIHEKSILTIRYDQISMEAYICQLNMYVLKTVTQIATAAMYPTAKNQICQWTVLKFACSITASQRNVFQKVQKKLVWNNIINLISTVSTGQLPYLYDMLCWLRYICCHYKDTRTQKCLVPWLTLGILWTCFHQLLSPLIGHIQLAREGCSVRSYKCSLTCLSYVYSQI